jgi:hypothetical protein
MLSQGGPTHYDFDAAGRWAANTGTRSVGPKELLLMWDILAAADAVFPPAPFDAMGLAAVQERLDRHEIAAAHGEFIMLGMKLSGIVAQAERRVGPEAERIHWPSDTTVWNIADDSSLARIIRSGITHFGSRLSPDAAQTDVSATWPKPQPAALVARFRGSGDLDVQLHRQPPMSPREVATYIEDHSGGTHHPDTIRRSGAVSAAALARYSRDRAEYADDLREWLRLEEAFGDAQRRTVAVRVWIRNEGDKTANAVEARMTFPSGIVVLPSGSQKFAATIPEEPLPATAYENPAAKRNRIIPRLRPSYREQGVTGMYNASERVTSGPAGSTIVEHHLSAIGAHDGAEAGQVTVQFPNWDAVHPFTVTVALQAGDGTVATSQLRVNASVAPQKR